MANQYLERIEAARQEGIRIGLETGLQIGCDMACLVLREPEVMGKDTFGAKRIPKFIQFMRDKMKLFEKAWLSDEDALYAIEKALLVIVAIDIAAVVVLLVSLAMIWAG